MIHPALVPMFQECLRYRLPGAYHADFVIHDQTALDGLPTTSTPFIWVLRENGTHILDNFTKTPTVIKFVRLFAYEERHFYIWANQTLVEYSPEELASAWEKVTALESVG